VHAAIAVIAVVVVVVLAAALFRRRDTGYDVDKFERARSLTTEWARRSEPMRGAPDGADVAGAAPRDGDRPHD
jgi:hypothetical protein